MLTLQIGSSAVWGNYRALSAEGISVGRRQTWSVVYLQVAEEDYGQLVERENINREEAGVDASGLEAAVAALVVGDSSPEDRHPEKCAPGFCWTQAACLCLKDCASDSQAGAAVTEKHNMCSCFSQQKALLCFTVRGALWPHQAWHV